MKPLSILSVFTGNLWRAGCIALALLCLGLFIGNKSLRSERDKAREQLGGAIVRLGASNDSIDRLQAEVNRMLQEAIARDAALERSKKLAAQQNARFDKQQRETSKRIVHLNEMADNLSSDCTVPAEMLRELEGL